MTFDQYDGCETLKSSISYLAGKSFNGDQGGEYMNYWDWNVVTCAALGILNDALSQIHMEAYK